MPNLETVDYDVKDRVAEITMRRAPVNAILMVVFIAAFW